ncbi:MAG TPA: hypothetical protein VI111_02240 [Thermoleophilaceae bacterium]
MRKLSIAAISAIAVLAFSGVAYAANLYGLPIASTAPKGVGSPTKPVPTGVKFGYTVKDTNGPRGAPVKTYKIAFQGLTTKYAKNFPTCKFSDTAPDAPLATIDAKCKKAKLGTGRIESLVTTDALAGDPTSVLFYCNLQLTLYNLGYGMAIRLDADNTPQPTSQDGPIGCIVNTHRAIEAKFKNVKIGGVASSSLNFDVPEDLRHNSGLSITVGNTESTIKKKSTKVKIKGKKRAVGVYSSIGCGKGKKREVRVTFVDENGVSSNSSKKVGC